MGYFNKLGEQLGEGTGKGINFAISKFFLGISKLCLAFFAWYRPSSWQPPEKNADFLRYNTFRIALLSVILTLTFSSTIVRFSFTHPEDSEKITFIVQLDSGRHVGVPPRGFFDPHASGDDTFFQNGFTYKRYKHGDHVLETYGLCAVIPAGHSVFIETRVPPSDVMNMELEAKVGVGQLMEPLTGFEKVVWSAFGKPKATYRDWYYIHDHWSAIDSVRYSILATARSARNIPYPHAGGMVCF